MSGRGGCGLPRDWGRGETTKPALWGPKCGLSFGKARDLVQKPAGPGPVTVGTGAFGLRQGAFYGGEAINI